MQPMLACLLSVVFLVRQKNYSDKRRIFNSLLGVSNVLKHGLSCLLYYIKLSEVFSNLTVILYILEKKTT